MIQYVDQNGQGYSKEEMELAQFKHLDIPGVELTFVTLEEALEQSRAVIVWSEDDGDGNELCLELHRDGFLLSLDGDNYASPEDQEKERAYVGTWLTSSMLVGLQVAMVMYQGFVITQGDDV